MSYEHTFSPKRLWLILVGSTAITLSILLYYGSEIYQKAPPFPFDVISESGETVFSQQQMLDGQDVWRQLGGMEMGSIWGHGSYLPPDWTADWIRKESDSLLQQWALRDRGVSFEALGVEDKAALHARLQANVRPNRFDEASQSITVSQDRVDAINAASLQYDELFGDHINSAVLREQYALPENPIPDASQRESLSAFFFWTAWSAVTLRVDDTVSYTSNWPHDARIGNTPTPALFLWTFISIMLLLAGVGALAWYYAREHANWGHELQPEVVPAVNPLANIKTTPSMRAVAKYFWVVAAMFGLQMTLGAITAHYQVEGQEFYGFPLADILPYAVTRTWHIQLAVFWIATAWLATGLYIAPLLSGVEPPWQRFGVNLLLAALVIVVAGSMFGEWAGVQRWFDFDTNFWFGHQGYEYVDLGRFWQILLFIGLLLWLFLVARAIAPAIKSDPANKHLIWLVVVASIAIALLYGAGFMWGKSTNISIMEYWRWWVVHLWVEGVFEVFATGVIALLFVKMGLLRSSTATISVLFATIVFLTGGMLGTFHHLYWSGTPIAVIAIGGVFSALEVVPLVLIGFEAYDHYKMKQSSDWVRFYHWPIMFMLAVAFWNLVGAGLLGFLINPPLALYYMQGLMTTATHAHAALFGVYGMLAIGLLLFCMRGLSNPANWSDGLLKWAFWSFNIGLGLMLVLSLLPQGIVQTMVSVRDGYWFARSPELMHSPLMETLVWMRVPGDIVFAFGVGCLVLFMIRLYRKPTGEIENEPMVELKQRT